MYEAEVKFRVVNPEAVRAVLDSYARSFSEVYSDTYLVEETLISPGSERELRLRTVECEEGVRSLLTFKDEVVDSETLSKKEREVELVDAAATLTLLRAIGFRVDISFQKRCINWKFQQSGLTILATLAEVPEIEGTFLEVETMVSALIEVAPAIEELRNLARNVGLERKDETTETYTGAVRSARATGS